MAKPKYERHFAGRSNAGLRKRIREIAINWGVDMPPCESVGGQIRSLAGKVALTPLGLACLELVAADYDAIRGRFLTQDLDATGIHGITGQEVDEGTLEARKTLIRKIRHEDGDSIWLFQASTDLGKTWYEHESYSAPVV